MSNSSSKRIEYIDALRGVALILALSQHLGVWMAGFNLGSFPIIYYGNGIGGLAAPLFVCLAGVSAMLYAHSRERSDLSLLKRGLLVIGFAYLLNFAAPHFFSHQAWFVLHMIGFGIFTTPLLRRLPISLLVVFCVFVTIVTVAGQNFLHTPAYLSWNRMINPYMEYGMWRLVLFEGHFPIFPWIGFYAAGVIAGKLLLHENYRALFLLSVVSFVSSLLILLISFLKLESIESSGLAGYFRWYLGFYPCSPWFFFATVPFFYCSLLVFRYLGTKVHFRSNNALVIFGRISLSAYMAHFIIFSYLYGIHQVPAVGPYLLFPAVGAVILCFALASLLWHRVGFRFGPEWIMRKVAA